MSIKVRSTRRLPVCLSSAVIACGLCFAPSSARGQAQVAASRDISINVYGGFTSLAPHIGPDRDFGYLLGGNIDKHFRSYYAGLDLRYTSATGTYADESAFLGGVKFGRDFGRFHPYLDFLVGHGNVHFDHPELISNNPAFTHDDSTVYDGGIGLDYDLTPRFAVKVDAQVQRWRTGTESQVFNPNNISVGLVYHIPFRYLRPSRY